MNIPFALPGCSAESLPKDGSDRLVIQVLRDEAGAPCPDCERTSRSVHSRYCRTPADLPCSTSRTTLRIEVRRFYCLNQSCKRRTFAERWPELVEPHARRTRRLAEIQSRVGIACGGQGGARLLTPLRMPASAATVLRLVKAMPVPPPSTPTCSAGRGPWPASPEAPSPRHVGVDDWAMRKGRTYGTIVVDLDRHRVIDLLPDRTAATLADWLGKRPGIRVVARDRSTEYARGASLGSPSALQVADRWHLLANMRQAVERWLHGAHAGLRRLAPSIGSTLVTPRRERAFSRSASERQAGVEGDKRWWAVYDEVRRRRAIGETLLGIARDMGLARATVRKYAAAETFPARLPHGPGPSLLDPHIAYLVQRIGEGCENAMALWRALRERGFPGTSRQVHRFVAERRTKQVRSGRKPQGTTPAAKTPVSGPVLPSPRQLAWLLVQPVSALDTAAAAVVAHVEQDETASAVARVARRFTALIRAAGVGSMAARGRDPVVDFINWLEDAKTCGAVAIATFAAGLEGDAVAVKAALTEPWSSGQVEGQVNRLKLIKRQSYGRAGLDLLRRRMVLAA